MNRLRSSLNLLGRRYENILYSPILADNDALSLFFWTENNLYIAEKKYGNKQQYNDSVRDNLIVLREKVIASLQQVLQLCEYDENGNILSFYGTNGSRKHSIPHTLHGTDIEVRDSPTAAETVEATEVANPKSELLCSKGRRRSPKIISYIIQDALLTYLNAQQAQVNINISEIQNVDTELAIEKRNLAIYFQSKFSACRNLLREFMLHSNSSRFSSPGEKHQFVIKILNGFIQAYRKYERVYVLLKKEFMTIVLLKWEESLRFMLNHNYLCLADIQNLNPKLLVDLPRMFVILMAHDVKLSVYHDTSCAEKFRQLRQKLVGMNYEEILWLIGIVFGANKINCSNGDRFLRIKTIRKEINSLAIELLRGECSRESWNLLFIKTIQSTLLDFNLNQ